MKATTKPSGKQPAPAMELKSLGSYRDLATEKGSSQIAIMTVRDYLAKLGLFDGTAVSEMRPEVAASFQRGVLNINTNAIKQRMFRDLLRGGTLPLLVVSDDDDGTWKIIDGLQRTSVILEALRTILALESQTKPQPFASKEIAEIIKLGQTTLGSEEFLARPVIIQLWNNLLPDKLIRLFMLLNVGRQNVSPRHLLEVIRYELHKMFEDWDLPVSTLRSEKEHPGHRGRRSNAEKLNNPIVEKPHTFRFEYLINGLIAYASRDPQTKTSQTLHDDGASFSDRIGEIGSELCKIDFQWTCVELYNIMREKHGDKKGNALLTDAFFIPTTAANGWARQDKCAKSIESRQAELLELLQESESPDPLVLDDVTRGLNKININVKSSIGRKRRGIIFASWKRFSRDGITNRDYPTDWEGGNLND